jgi:hypothetical protein
LTWVLLTGVLAVIVWLVAGRIKRVQK